MADSNTEVHSKKNRCSLKPEERVGRLKEDETLIADPGSTTLYGVLSKVAVRTVPAFIRPGALRIHVVLVHGFEHPINVAVDIVERAPAVGDRAPLHDSARKISFPMNS